MSRPNNYDLRMFAVEKAIEVTRMGRDFTPMLEEAESIFQFLTKDRVETRLPKDYSHAPS